VNYAIAKKQPLNHLQQNLSLANHTLHDNASGMQDVLH
jgi:hypothetical protein